MQCRKWNISTVPPQSLWNRILAEPDRAPEHIALAAAERFGPGGRDWVAGRGARAHAAEARQDGADEARADARLEGAALGIGGVITAAPDLVALLWIQSRMVFYIAAAHGYDPLDPMRPAELLTLLRLLRRPPRTPGRALDGMGKRLAQAAAERALRSARRERRCTMRLLRSTSRKRLTRHARRALIPFIGAPIGAVQNAAAPRRSSAAAALGCYSGPPVDGHRGAAGRRRVLGDEEAHHLRDLLGSHPLGPSRRRAAPRGWPACRSRSAGSRCSARRRPCTRRRAPARRRARAALPAT